jgi:hypothetical protein
MALVLALAFLPCHAIAQKALSPESVAVYRAFLSGYNNGSHTVLNIAEKTVLFSPSFDPDSTSSCLKGFGIDAAPSTQLHLLNAAILPDGLKARVISADKVSPRDPEDAIRNGKSVDEALRQDFAAGVLTLSEVVFNADHTKALLSYSFYCGSLCGHGGAMLFEKHSGQWDKGKPVCGSWVS